MVVGEIFMKFMRDESRLELVVLLCNKIHTASSQVWPQLLGFIFCSSGVLLYTACLENFMCPTLPHPVCNLPHPAVMSEK